MEKESYSAIRSEKKKKKKRNPESEMEVEKEEDHVIRSEKKKKKKDITSVVAEMEEDDDDDVIRGEEKKKKKKKKDRNPVEEEDDDILRSEEKKKKKKRKEIVEEDDDNVIRSEEEEEEEEKKEKKKKKKKREKIDVKMEIVSEHKDMTAPLVGYFPSGFDPQKAPHQPDVKVYRHKQKSNRLQLVVSPRNSNIDFVGTSYAGEASASQVCTYALGVLDKETKCLKIVPIASNKIFRLEPRVAGSDSYEKALVVKEEPLTRTEKAKRIKILTIGLGTKDSRKKAEKEEKMKLKESASVQKDMEKKIKNVVVNKEALETTAALAVRNIPPHDSTATTPEQAYPLDKIILQSEWHYLRDVLQCVQSEKELPSNVYPSFVRNRAQKLLEIKDEMERDTLAGIFSFINHLIKFKDQQSYDTKESVKSHRVPEILFQKFRTMFTDPGGFKPSNEKKDLLVSYVLVLTLYADSFKTDPSDIAKDLRLTKISLRPYFLNLGCKLSRVDKQDVMTLPVPLEFPKPSNERRRR